MNKQELRATTEFCTAVISTIVASDSAEDAVKHVFKLIDDTPRSPTELLQFQKFVDTFRKTLTDRVEAVGELAAIAEAGLTLVRLKSRALQLDDPTLPLDKNLRSMATCRSTAKFFETVKDDRSIDEYTSMRDELKPNPPLGVCVDTMSNVIRYAVLQREYKRPDSEIIADIVTKSRAMEFVIST